MSTTMRPKDKVRVAVIGAGDMANRVHYPSLASFSDVEIAAICDTNATRLHATADAYSIRQRYTDFQVMIKECAPDGVYAIGQPHIMYDVWMWCLQQQQNLFIEKPMGLTWHQAQMLAHAARVNQVITQVGHQRRSSPLLVKMRETCLDRGPITHAVCEFYKDSPGPYVGARDHMLDDCVHAIDTLRWICGGEVIEIASRCKRVDVPDINWIAAMVHFDTGATGLLVNSWSSGRRIFRVEMHAPGIYVDADVDGTARLYANGDTVGVTYDARDVAGSAEYYVYGGFQAKSREFVDSLKWGKDITSSPFSDCVKTMEVAEKILAQALLRGE